MLIKKKFSKREETSMRNMFTKLVSSVEGI